ncbi:MAG TPA: L-threonylcarbamoyladenylate synthase [Chitinophagaceae bacterium]|nr:L-threonylcarbamoyladenylate synthase [Chitinophagaceae bacterium]
MNSFAEDITESFKVLEKGGLILYPTDTVWGIGCDATHAGAVQRIFELKCRNSSRSLIILVNNMQDLAKYVLAPHAQVIEYLKREREPVTVIYPGASNLPSNLISPDGTIAIRIVQEPFCNSLITRLGKPLVSTSANFTGEPTSLNFFQVPQRIKDAVDYIVHYRREELREGKPSKIVKVDPHGAITILRQ